jgi:uncharacterized protein DUF955
VTGREDQTGISFDNTASPAAAFDRDVTRRALDELFTHARQYKSSKAYFELLRFIVEFRFYSPFNAMLVHMQLPGASFVAPAHVWRRRYGRALKPDARPLVILQPMGPVMFVFDVGHTKANENAVPLPHEVTSPFEIRGGSIKDELARTRANAARDGVCIVEKEGGSQGAGAIKIAEAGRSIVFTVKGRPEKHVTVPVRYDLWLNSTHSAEAKYATVCHELAHLYCGHLGTPNERWWPDRRGLDGDVEEFEAESVSYLICGRLGIATRSAEYLSSFIKEHSETPWISLDCVLKTAGLIDQMGRERLKPRRNSQSDR